MFSGVSQISHNFISKVPKYPSIYSSGPTTVHFGRNFKGGADILIWYETHCKYYILKYSILSLTALKPFISFMSYSSSLSARYSFGLSFCKFYILKCGIYIHIWSQNKLKLNNLILTCCFLSNVNSLKKFSPQLCKAFDTLLLAFDTPIYE